jgi:hypothetical protein
LTKNKPKKLWLTKTKACKRLGIQPEQLLTMPQITPMIEGLSKRLKNRGLSDDPFFYLNTSSDPDAQRLMVIYRSSIPSIRSVVPLEAFCLAAAVDPNSILDSIVSAIQRAHNINSTVNLAVTQPGTVEAIAENALLPSEAGYKDRELHMKISGLYPMPKGNRTTVNVNNTANASSAPVQNFIAPAPEQTVRRLSERLHAMKVQDAIVVNEE